MLMNEWDEEVVLDEINESGIDNNLEGSSFVHHAVPLEDLTTLEENGIEFSIKEMMEIRDVKDEY